MEFSKDQVTGSLRLFVARRDDLLHEDEAAFEHYLQRFVQFCQEDALAQSIIGPLQQNLTVNVDEWWQKVNAGELQFPPESNAELLLRYEILGSLADKPQRVLPFGVMMRKYKRDESIDLFRSVIIRPFAEEMTSRLGEAANLASPQARDLQAVPLHRIPKVNETRIFLSHKSLDKALVYRYYYALKELGFSPWLDEPDMPAGANLERELLRGFNESCAAVFFITESFADEKYLAAEVDYAIKQKREKGRKFAIITVRYPNASAVPELLTPYVYKDVENDLEGFYEVLRALPIELGPVRWRARVVEE